MPGAPADAAAGGGAASAAAEALLSNGGGYLAAAAAASAAAATGGGASGEGGGGGSQPGSASKRVPRELRNLAMPDKDWKMELGVTATGNQRSAAAKSARAASRNSEYDDGAEYDEEGGGPVPMGGVDDADADAGRADADANGHE